ncbi:MAG: hypothetical protein QG653_131 [Patescibacteria group bacterium]|nr:hypothetical protein [Patescibacteria group bacterium]
MKYDLKDILHSLDLPPSSQKIYAELLENGETTARMLSERLSLTRPSTYDHLALLKKKGLIIEKKVENKKYFAIDDVKHIGVQLKEKKEELSHKEKLFTELLPELLKYSRTESPVIKFFEGKDGLTHLLNDILWYKGETIHTMWPYTEMLHVLGKEVLVRFNERRLQSKILIRTLWPHEKVSTKDYIWNGKDTLTEKRFAKKSVTWNMGYTIYGDKVSFISSHKEVFGFIVTSKDFVELMKVQFNVIWEASK